MWRSRLCWDGYLFPADLRAFNNLLSQTWGDLPRFIICLIHHHFRRCRVVLRILYIDWQQWKSSGTRWSWWARQVLSGRRCGFYSQKRPIVSVLWTGLVRASSLFPILSTVLLMMGGLCVGFGRIYSKRNNILLSAGILFVAAGRTRTSGHMPAGGGIFYCLCDSCSHMCPDVAKLSSSLTQAWATSSASSSSSPATQEIPATRKTRTGRTSTITAGPSTSAPSPSSWPSPSASSPSTFTLRKTKRRDFKAGETSWRAPPLHRLIPASPVTSTGGGARAPVQGQRILLESPPRWGWRSGEEVWGWACPWGKYPCTPSAGTLWRPDVGLWGFTAQRGILGFYRSTTASRKTQKMEGTGGPHQSEVWAPEAPVNKDDYRLFPLDREARNDVNTQLYVVYLLQAKVDIL